jgi:hypothetical protein
MWYLSAALTADDSSYKSFALHRRCLQLIAFEQKLHIFLIWYLQQIRLFKIEDTVNIYQKLIVPQNPDSVKQGSNLLFNSLNSSIGHNAWLYTGGH